MTVKNLKIAVLIEDTKNPDNPRLESKHGLSFFIQAKIGDNNLTVLMDTGPSGEALLHNVDELGVNLEEVDAVVLSHGHYDHTGGLMAALKRMKKGVLVIGHPSVFEHKFALMPHLRSIGAPLNVSDVEGLGGVPLLTVDSVKVADGVVTTGEVPRVTSFESVKGFRTVHNGRFVDDVVLDDLSLVFDVEGKGLVVVSGCAHAGIINTVKCAQKITGNSKVYAVLGGFHLLSADDNRLQATTDGLKKFNPVFVGPCHCTGKKAKKRISETLGDQCRVLHTGDVIEF